MPGLHNAATATLLKARINHTRFYIGLLVILTLSCGARLSEHLTLFKLLQWSGYALVIFGVFIRVYCSVYIGGRKNDDLVMDGPFSIVRNPLYVGSFIATVGIGLQSGSFLLMALLVLGFVVYYPIVVRREEAFLTQRFGQPYTDYMTRTPRFLPKPALWQSPREIMCQPYRVFRTMLDGAMFFLPLPVLDALRLAQLKGLLPTLLLLP